LNKLIQGDGDTLNLMRDVVYNYNVEKGWHDTPDKITKALELARPELVESFKAYHTAALLALISSEVSEALEGRRKNLMDDHLTNRPMVEVELADAIIRILDLCGRYNYDIGGAVVDKFLYNMERADHKKENRDKENGKKF